MEAGRPTHGQDTASLLSLLSLWLILIAIGLADACLATYLGLSVFFSTAVHGTLLALVGANNWALQRDLEEKNSPIASLQETERRHTELIMKLNISNMMLERQNRILTCKLKCKRPQSKSWNPLPEDNHSI